MDSRKPMETPLASTWRKDDDIRGSSGNYCLQETCGFTHVLGEHMKKYVLCS